jgi:PAS domain S-box-containing protein
LIIRKCDNTDIENLFSGELLMVCVDPRNSIINGLDVKGNELFTFPSATTPKKVNDKLDYQTLDHVPNPIMVFNPDLSIAHVNPALEAMTGYTQKDLRGKKPPYPFWSDYDNLKFKTEIQQNLGGGNGIIEHLLLRKNGEQVPIKTKVSLVKDDNKLKYIIVHWTDITGRKKADEALQESRILFHSLFENMLEGYAYCQMIFEKGQPQDFVYLDVNSAFEKLTGLKNVVGRRVSEVIPGVKESNPALFEIYGRVSTTGQPEKFEQYLTPLAIWYSISVYSPKNGYFVATFDNITNRKQAEIKLSQSEAFNTSLLYDSPNPILVINPDGSIQYLNPALEKLTGYSKDEIMGRPFPPLWWPEDKVKDYDIQNLSAVKQKALIEERVIKNKKGELLWVNVSVNQIEELGKPKYYIANWVDITEKKKAGEQNRFQALLMDNISEAVISTDLNASILSWNKAAENIYGWKQEEVLGKRLFEVLQICSLTGKSMLGLSKQLEEKGVWKGDSYHRRRDGTVLNVYSSICRIKDGSGKAIGNVGIYRNITEQKKAEEKLCLAAQEWRTTFDSITDMIFIQDREGKLLRMNRAFSNAIHKLPQELIGLPSYDVIPGIKGTPLDWRYQKPPVTKTPLTIAFFEPSLGIDIEGSSSPVLAENGELLGSVNVLRDVTEHKKFAEKLMLTDRLATIGELAAGVAHELNNPLTSIIGFSQLVLDEEASPEIIDDLKIINSESQRAARIVKSLLTFGRKHQPVKQLNQINDCINEVLSLRAYEHKCRNIKVISQLDHKLAPLMFDYFQMQQVFINLIVNAEFFMSQAHNGGNLTVKTEITGGMIRTSVADDGTGITPENLKHLFNPFFTTKEVGKGTGLGLAICHGIVSEHGGNIYAQSEPGKGATFVVELPSLIN